MCVLSRTDFRISTLRWSAGLSVGIGDKRKPIVSLTQKIKKKRANKMMSQEEKQAEGNEAFKRKDYTHAIACYDACLSLLNKLFSSPDDTKIATKKAVIYSNRSACYQQLAKGKESTDIGRDYLKTALDDAESSIEHEASFIKGYYRASAAAKQAGDMKRSARFLEAGLKIDSSNEALDNELAYIQLKYPLRQIYGRVGGGRSKAVDDLLQDKPLKAWEAESSDEDESKDNDERIGEQFDIEDVADLVEIAVNTDYYEDEKKKGCHDAPERAANVLTSPCTKFSLSLSIPLSSFKKTIYIIDPIIQPDELEE